jgi:hypothetical protein
VRQRPSQATSAALQPQRRQTLGASGAPSMDASDGCSTASGERRTLTGLRLVNDGRATSVAMDASVGAKTSVGNLTAQDTLRPRERRTLDVASVAHF